MTESAGVGKGVYLHREKPSDSHNLKAEPFLDRLENAIISIRMNKRETRREVTKQERRENSAAGSVISLWKAVIVTTCYSPITHPSDLKEQVIRHLNVFTEILAVTASSYSHKPPHAELNRLNRAPSSAGSSSFMG